MDDLEMDILEMELEFQDVIEEMDKEERKSPDWFLIAIGSKYAPRVNYDKCREIYRSFKGFSKMHPGKEFFELVDLFTAAMIQNRLTNGGKE